MEQQAEEIDVIVPKHRSRYVSVKLEHIRVMVTTGRHIALSFNIEDGVMKLTTVPETEDREDIHRCAAFIKAVILGFSIPTASKFLHRDNLKIGSLKINTNDTYMKQNIIRTKSAIEDFTKTNILVNKDGNQLYILGTPLFIKNASDHISHLISLYN
ncbi:uncharacterized protein LOC113339463 [Papaver somniferum]|uniref:uncharacterized protein LOC113339463 n=1 Tax=Papaver somniferum TaxID=3469 RepID=UPI000E6FFC10|nr:uncharacterized protein LOC113339463 [Papaver somniferum]